MLTHADVRRLALALPEADEAPHFASASFRVRGRIFCTAGENGAGIILKFTPEDQHNLCRGDPERVAAVAGYWGRSGWTAVSLAGMDEARLADLIHTAWATVAPKRMLR